MTSLRTRLAVLGTTLAIAATSGPVIGSALTASASASAPLPRGLTELLEDGTPSGRAIATFPAVPTASQVTALRALGLTVQPMHALPLALVSGKVAALTSAVTKGVALDVYPDEKIQLLDTTSSNAMSSSVAAAKALRANGFTGKGVTVGVVDSGCDATQPDLVKRVVHNVTLVSPEYANQAPDSSTTLVVPEDQGPYSNSDIGGGHGTHVAGIVAADSANGVGMVGLAPDARILPVRVLDDGGSGTYETTARGIRWATGHGADVINLSLTLSEDDDRVRGAVADAVDAGVVVVAAAGNSPCPDEGPNPPVYPADYPGVVGVGSVSEAGNVSAFSSCGAWVDLVAPGSPIISIVPEDARKSECVDAGGACSLSGTSEAAPWVSAAAALALSLPDADPVTVAEALSATASDLEPAGRDDRSGAGLLDLAALLTNS